MSLGASVNLTLATGGERYGHFRSGGEGGGIRRPGRESSTNRSRPLFLTTGRGHRTRAVESAQRAIGKAIRAQLVKLEAVIAAKIQANPQFAGWRKL